MVAARVRGESGNGDFYQEYKGPLPFPGDGTVMAGLQIAKGKPTLTIPANSLSNGKFYQHASDTPAWPPYVHARGVSDRDLSRWWDSVALSDAESRVLQSLKIIAEIERINLIENPTRRKERIVMAKIAGESQPVPLKSLGDGMMRLFQIALAIECTRSNEPVQHPVFDIQHLFDNIARSAGIAMLLVDEIESGIHYRAMPDFWRFILRVAKLHDVQVFATSHSWDCIQALQEAASDTADADVMLIRLEKKEYATKAVLFDQRELAIVTRDNIEVR